MTFDVNKLGEEIVISVEFPSKLDGENFSRISLYRAVDGTYSFLVPLESFDSGDKLKTWFELASDLALNAGIEIVYGGDCGLVIEYKIPFAEVAK